MEKAVLPSEAPLFLRNVTNEVPYGSFAILRNGRIISAPTVGTLGFIETS